MAGNNGPWSAGKANGELHLIDGDLFLNYSGGDLCHHNNLTRNTIINFVCAKNGTGRGQPVFVDEDDDCNYFLSWHTDLACEQQVGTFQGGDLYKCMISYRSCTHLRAVYVLNIEIPFICITF